MPAIKHSRTFGERRPPHTIIIARGDHVRHFTIAPSRLVAAGVLAATLTLSLIAGPGWYWLDGSTGAASESTSRRERDYETRIAMLRAQLDTATSRQFLAQKMVETKVDVLLGQQEELAARYDKLAPLLERAKAGGLVAEAVPIPTPKPDFSTEMAAEAGAASDSLLAEDRGAAPAPPPAPMPPDLARARLRGADTPAGPAVENHAELRADDHGVSDEALHRIGRAIDRAELRQVRNLQSLAASARTRTVKIASALKAAGIAVPEGSQASAAGGPFEPATHRSAFEQSYAEVDEALTQLQKVRSVAATLPLAEPMAGGVISSTFGVRPDPFLGRPAMHTGIDYAEPEGTMVRATAPGIVTRAGPAGGYGNMVEIDHGDGVSSRYGHMSRIDVSVGEKLVRNQTIGAVGSTGRSTGPHLHYEVRRNEEPVDPESFYRIGRRIAAID
ncbi:M23 family metallopeptidase [Aurantimonas sp. VKM B-3413]|uniref:M23 family metallopeptidase n=1 Tax=Aurantimonas sp. VKM B-3413 TaxID=2779401 RepID=UPI001E61B3A8|nr:M23 family metallopeptidase [Aurantimonas sp. VKM B-3413]MCB8839860.1 M23 family metallopeptidase [Aurantimonas sp. VKM B-3413]